MRTVTDLAVTDWFYEGFWLRGVDLNHRPLGYEPNVLAWKFATMPSPPQGN